MSIMPNTVCQRCHRKYPSVRSRCPYCGTRKPREVKRSVPESDSTVRGTAAARRRKEDVNWQMLISGILLLCIIAAVITIVSVNVKEKVGDSPAASPEEMQGGLVNTDTTAIPSPSATPTATPEPTTPITKIEIQYYGAVKPDFMESKGTQVQLEAVIYPITTENPPAEWYSSDESIATVDDTGLVTVVGESGQVCDIVAKAPNGMEAKCRVYVR